MKASCGCHSRISLRHSAASMVPRLVAPVLERDRDEIADGLAHDDQDPRSRSSLIPRELPVINPHAAGMQIREISMRRQFLATAASFSIIVPAYSQTHSDLLTDEVVVTATRFEEKPGDQPIGVTVITGEEIRSAGETSLPSSVNLDFANPDKAFWIGVG